MNGNNVFSHYLDGLNGLQRRPQRLGHNVVGGSSPTVFFLASGVLTQLENFQSCSHAFPFGASCLYLSNSSGTDQILEVVIGSFGPTFTIEALATLLSTRLSMTRTF